MSSVQVADQTFVAARAEDVATLVSDTRRWRAWFPGLRVTVQEDRAEKGVRWVVAGQLRGTMEVWLEPMLDGVILHYFLHAEPADGVPGPSVHRRRVLGKQMSFEIKALLEKGRAAGEPPVPGLRS